MSEINAKQLLFAGGPVMIPIIFCWICALMIIIKKWRYFQNLKSSIAPFKSEIFALVRENKIKSAVLACEKSSLPAGSILKAGLLKFGCRREEIRETLDDAVFLEIPKLEHGLTALITIANATPLFGVLGTVIGLTIIFQTIQSQSAGMYAITPADLSGGIWQALLTTLTGLIVAIPAFVAYNYFIESLNIIINELNAMSNQLANLLAQIHESTSEQITDIA